MEALSRRPRLAALLASAALLVSTAALPASSASAGSRPPAPAVHAARTFDVMTRNLYLGASLDDIVAALTSGDQNAIIDAATKTWNTVQASDPAERMAAVADEIAAARPTVVGLQEVTVWSTYVFDPSTQQTVGDPTVVYDFLELLLKALADRGVVYHEVRGATSPNFSSDPIPVLTGQQYPTSAVTLQDRDVILRRQGVRTWDAHHGNFDTILQPPLAPITIERGWGSADVRTKHGAFRFVNSHTEAFGPEEIRIGEVLELFAAQQAIAQRHGRLPTVYVGDYNSPAPAGGAYATLVSRLSDAWVAANGSAPGFTCCQDSLLDNQVSELDQRIDLVLTTAGVRAKSARVVGNTPVDLPGDTWWASDHAGVVARLKLPAPHHG